MFSFGFSICVNAARECSCRGLVFRHGKRCRYESQDRALVWLSPCFYLHRGIWDVYNMIASGFARRWRVDVLPPLYLYEAGNLVICCVASSLRGTIFLSVLLIRRCTGTPFVHRGAFGFWHGFRALRVRSLFPQIVVFVLDTQSAFSAGMHA